VLIGWLGLTLTTMAIGQAIKSISGAGVLSSAARFMLALALFLTWLIAWWRLAKIMVDKYSARG